eukprot:m51a1_g1026 hypothetical protein (576) ;mRNA; r:653502-657745
MQWVASLLRPAPPAAAAPRAERPAPPAVDLSRVAAMAEAERLARLSSPPPTRPTQAPRGPPARGQLADAVLVVGAGPADALEAAGGRAGAAARVLAGSGRAHASVAQFCFPRGCVPTAVVDDDGEDTGIVALLYSSGGGAASALRSSSFSFRLEAPAGERAGGSPLSEGPAGDGSPGGPSTPGSAPHTPSAAASTRYGFCVWRWEPVNWPVLRDWSAQPTGGWVVAPRCYCVVSRYPFYGLHFGLLRDLLEADRFGLVSHTVCDDAWACAPLGSPLSCGGSDDDGGDVVSFSEDLESSPRGPLVAGPAAKTPKPSTAWEPCTSHVVLATLARYRALCAPGAGESVSFVASEDVPRARTFVRPPRWSDDPDDEASALGGAWGAPALARCMPRGMLAPLLGAVLAERRVVLTCASPAVLSRACTALVALVRPFRYCSLVSPLLPARMHDALDAPVPFVVGTLDVPRRLYSADVVIADLDARELFLPEPLPAPVPRSAELERRVRPLLRAIARSGDAEEQTQQSDAAWARVAEAVSMDNLASLSLVCRSFRTVVQSLMQGRLTNLVLKSQHKSKIPVM